MLNLAFQAVVLYGVGSALAEDIHIHSGGVSLLGGGKVDILQTLNCRTCPVYIYSPFF